MPEQVGRYRILRQLGRGGMGVVFLAEDPLLHRNVAIKMLDLSVDEGADREFLQGRLLRDARAAAILSHSNIVSIHDVIEEAGAAYVVMEYLGGESLAAYLKHRPLPDPAFVVKVLRAMASALDYTHAHGVIHRDIKPANVMFDVAGNLKILDFGIARLSDAHSSTATATGMVMGTVEYMAPEQIKGEAMDGRADQFSLAAVAYQMMTGGTLFGYHSLATLTYKIVNEMPPSVRTRNSALPATVDGVVAKALSKSPDGRFANCTAFVDALELALTGGTSTPGPLVDKSTLPTQPLSSPVQAPPPPSQPVPAAAQPFPPPAAPAQARPASHAGLLIGIAAGLVVLIAAGGGLMMWKPWVRPSLPVVTAPPAVTVNKPTASVPPPDPTAQSSTQPTSNSQPTSSVQPAPAPPPTQPEPAAPVAAQPKSTAPRRAQPASTPPLPPPVETDEPAEAISHTQEPEVPPATQPTSRTTSPAPLEPPAPVTSNSPAPPQPDVQAYRQGRGLLRGRAYLAAVQSFTKAISLRRDYAEAYHYRGLAYQLLEQYVAAIKDYSEAIRLRSDDALSYTDRGICLSRLHRDDQALADFNQTLKLRPNSPEASPALNGRGVIFIRRQQYNSALHDLNLAISLSPDYEVAYQNRGQARQALGNEAGAAEDFRKAKELEAVAAKSRREM